MPTLEQRICLFEILEDWATEHSIPCSEEQLRDLQEEIEDVVCDYLTDSAENMFD